MCQACLPAPKSWVSSALCRPAHAEKEQRGKRSLWLYRETLTRDEEQLWTTNSLASQERWSPAIHSYSMVDQNSPKTSNTNIPARVTLAYSFQQVLKYYGNNIRSLSGGHQYGEHGLVMGRLESAGIGTKLWALLRVSILGLGFGGTWAPLASAFKKDFQRTTHQFLLAVMCSVLLHSSRSRCWPCEGSP